MPKALQLEIEAARNRGNYEEISEIKGNKIFLKGHQYPMNGVPYWKAVNAINKIKKLVRFPTKRNQQRALFLLQPHIRQDSQPITAELQKLIPTQLGILFAYILEYDSAYRYRVQDLLNETSAAELSKRPIQELWRLLAINKQRDLPGVHKKFKQFTIILTLLLCWPPFRRKWKYNLQHCNFENLQPDEADRYWIAKRTDYGINKL